ncbi:eukaryotic translation initiation factor 3 subunit C-like [Aphis gossypii]|uniref:Eukaryotic translation initiation factor 3 subunit C N-terminal domain-containing protein n=1 Tax=Aphis gossypii TaxID=80765 RepID=A0A9P0JH77_APHGO|nr:eukaryotic translation initiation factor 3 subunit C-like [Aphis gossypii]CAH1738692.1 unnamed protein product [Aphis gossypii]
MKMWILMKVKVKIQLLHLKKSEEKIPKVAKTGGDSNSDNSFDWGNDSESSSSSSEDKGQYQSIRERFLKKSSDKDDDEKKKERKEKPKKLKREKEDESDSEWQKVRRGVAISFEKPKMFAKDAEITPEAVLRKLTEVIAAHGKKRTDRREQFELLHELLLISEAHVKLGELRNKYNVICGITFY